MDTAQVRFQVSALEPSIAFYTQQLGFKRIVLYVDDLLAHIDRLKAAGVRFRNEIEVGPGGSQILLDDPDGNPIELHQSPK